MSGLGEGDREKMRGRPISENLNVCNFYDKGTHKCLADGTSICLDPNLAKEEDCETARDAKKLDQAISRDATKLDVVASNSVKE